MAEVIVASGGEINPEAVYDAVTKAQKAIIDLAQPLVGYKPVMKRLDLALTSIENANLWISAALMALSELQKAQEKATPPTLKVL